MDAAPDRDPTGSAGPAAPRVAYGDALRRYDGALLAGIARALGLTDPPSGRTALADRVSEHLGEYRGAERLVPAVPPAARLAMTLLAVTESTSWSSQAMAHALACLGVELVEAVGPLVGLGLLAIAPEGGAVVRDPLAELEASGRPGSILVAHPSAVAAARTARPEGAGLPLAGPVRQVREADGLEPILRMAVVWQRVADAPLRQTQQGTLYKRDRDRVEDDPVVAGPIADAIEPLPDMGAFWLALARGVGLLEEERGSERVVAARHGFWGENAIHLPQMAAARWLGLRTWHELGGIQRDGAVYELALPYVRPAVLLWLATLGDDEWVALDDLADFLRARSPRWDRATFAAEPPLEPQPAAQAPARTRAAKARPKTEATAPAAVPGTLDAMLLGAGYQLGVVRAAEEVSTGRRAVQLTPLGRYLLALGPPAPQRPTYEHFLFVQPSFEVIAYRQGLTPALIGLFSRFALWSQVGAAMALRLTPESLYRGLEGGLTPQEMLDQLARHSQRPLPPGVSEAVRTWAGRRERVAYHASATLVEFASAADLDQALRQWPDGPGPAPVRVSDRLILVEDESTIPFSRYRLTGSRDYRRLPEPCVDVEPDGVTLTLDLARSDLLVDAELARFADEQAGTAQPWPPGPRRRFVVSSDSLARGAESGLTPALLAHWFRRRTGGEIPPAIRLLLAARASRVAPLTTSRPLVLHAPSSETLDGLAQHPATRDLLGERLGPTSAVIPDEALGPFRRALERLGLSLDDEATVRPFPAGSRTAPR
jgi:hypothetical protein